MTIDGEEISDINMRARRVSVYALVLRVIVFDTNKTLALNESEDGANSLW